MFACKQKRFIILLPSSILAACHAYLNLLDLITLTIIGERHILCGAFSTPHSHPSWAQIFASGSCFQISLAWIPPLMYLTQILLTIN